MYPETEIAFIKPDRSQGDQIVHMLALAFENGPGISKICKAEGEELRRRLRLLFRAGSAMQAAANQPILILMKEDRTIGVAVFQEPGSDFPLWAQFRWLLQVSFGIGPLVAWRIGQNSQILERHHPPEPHYYLTLLAIHPSFQGRGYARFLLDALHRCSEAHSISRGIYLETANPKNVKLYEHFGYHLMMQLDLSGIETFLMFRPNQLQ